MAFRDFMNDSNSTLLIMTSLAFTKIEVRNARKELTLLNFVLDKFDFRQVPTKKILYLFRFQNCFKWNIKIISFSYYSHFCEKKKKKLSARNSMHLFPTK